MVELISQEFLRNAQRPVSVMVASLIKLIPEINHCTLLSEDEGNLQWTVEQGFLLCFNRVKKS